MLTQDINYPYYKFYLMLGVTYYLLKNLHIYYLAVAESVIGALLLFIMKHHTFLLTLLSVKFRF